MFSNLLSCVYSHEKKQTIRFDQSSKYWTSIQNIYSYAVSEFISSSFMYVALSDNYLPYYYEWILAECYYQDWLYRVLWLARPHITAMCHVHGVGDHDPPQFPFLRGCMQYLSPCYISQSLLCYPTLLSKLLDVFLCSSCLHYIMWISYSRSLLSIRNYNFTDSKYNYPFILFSLKLPCCPQDPSIEFSTSSGRNTRLLFVWKMSGIYCHIRGMI